VFQCSTRRIHNSILLANGGERGSELSSDRSITWVETGNNNIFAATAEDHSDRFLLRGFLLSAVGTGHHGLQELILFIYFLNAGKYVLVSVLLMPQRLLKSDL
jgi:hypothetical protein